MRLREALFTVITDERPFRVKTPHGEITASAGAYLVKALSDAVRAAVAMTAERDTLVLVTADHGMAEISRDRVIVLDDVVEPEWPVGHDREWGQWSPLRGRLLPGGCWLIPAFLSSTLVRPFIPPSSGG